jgi:hypothetical protein
VSGASFKERGGAIYFSRRAFSVIVMSEGGFSFIGRELSDLQIGRQLAPNHLLNEEGHASLGTLVAQPPYPVWVHLAVPWSLLTANNHPAREGEEVRRQH